MSAPFDVTLLPMNMREKIMVSFDPKLTNGTVCWEWTGAAISTGYGSVGIGNKKSALTHRVAYEIIVGPIPPGLTIDHLCFTKICVNTDHMEPVTRGENSRRKLALQTHCTKGHPLSGDNLYLKTRRTGLTYRVCKKCHNGWNRAWRAKARKRPGVTAPGQNINN